MPLNNTWLWDSLGAKIYFAPLSPQIRPTFDPSGQVLTSEFAGRGGANVIQERINFTRSLSGKPKATVPHDMQRSRLRLAVKQLADQQTTYGISQSTKETGAAKTSESITSSTPPSPGSQLLESLICASRLRSDSARSPTIPASVTARP